MNFGRIDCGGNCEGDLIGDFDVDRKDLAELASDFGQTDCHVNLPLFSIAARSDLGCWRLARLGRYILFFQKRYKIRNKTV